MTATFTPCSHCSTPTSSAARIAGRSRPPRRPELHRARAVAEGTLRYARTATRFARPALVNGDPGLVVAPHGRLRAALTIDIKNDKFTEINVIGQPNRLADLAISLPDLSAGNVRDDARGQTTRRDPEPSNSRGQSIVTTIALM